MQKEYKKTQCSPDFRIAEVKGTLVAHRNRREVGRLTNQLKKYLVDFKSRIRRDIPNTSRGPEASADVQRQ